MHVGNLPPGLTGQALKELFNATMRAAQLALDEGDCVNDVHVAADGKFGCSLGYSVAGKSIGYGATQTWKADIVPQPRPRTHRTRRQLLRRGGR